MYDTLILYILQIVKKRKKDIFENIHFHKYKYKLVNMYYI